MRQKGEGEREWQGRREIEKKGGEDREDENEVEGNR